MTRWSLSMPRLSRTVVCCCLAGLLVSAFLLRPFYTAEAPIAIGSILDKQRAFWLSISPHILENGPQCDPIVHPEIDDLMISYNESRHDVPRPDRITVTGTQFYRLHESHAKFMAHLRSKEYTLPFVSGTRGVVTTAGGKYLPVSVVSIRMLRATGCQLPVEVFLDSQDEWDSMICGTVLPSLGARCIVLRDIIDASPHKDVFELNRYQYKIMSIVFSSFEEVMFIDSDSFPIYDPTNIFYSKPFKRTGMIRFPDFWYPTESALFFEIADLALPNNWDETATESGELFYSKSRHTRSLLLAMYYNYYGPNFYYHLQSQGGPGEGDKETFFWSAVIFNEAFYTVKRGVDAIGYTTKAGEWRGSAMVQYDPIQDFDVQSLTNSTLQEESRARIRPMFLHCNMPKIDPAYVFDDFSFGATGPTKDADGTLRRIWFGDEQTSVEYFGFDLERRLWTIVREIACEYEGKFDAWKGRNEVCQTATRYWNAVFEAG